MHEYPWVVVNMLMHGGGIALLLLLAAAMLFNNHERRTSVRLGAALAIGGAAFDLIATPGVAYRFTLWHTPLMMLSAANPVVFWLFSRSVLDDDFVLRRWHGLMWFAVSAVGIYPCVMGVMPGTGGKGGLLSLSIPAIGLSVLTLFQALSTWREDLVESRRRLRLQIVLAVAAYNVLIHVMLLLVNAGNRATFGFLVNSAAAAALLGLGTVLCLRLLRAPPGLLERQRRLDPDGPVPDESAAESEPVALDDTDRTRLATLMHLMEVEQVYREPDLTIGALALRLAWPEHRLRRLINQALGHRNFNAFLNTWRVDDAKRSLQDSRYAGVAILTIATEAGFQSLGPFNRAFKAATGQTPTEFRRAAAGPSPSAAPEPATPLAESLIG